MENGNVQKSWEQHVERLVRIRFDRVHGGLLRFFFLCRSVLALRRTNVLDHLRYHRRRNGNELPHACLLFERREKILIRDYGRAYLASMVPFDYLVGDDPYFCFGNTVAEVLVLHAHVIAARLEVITTATAHGYHDDVVFFKCARPYLFFDFADDRAVQGARQSFIARDDDDARFVYPERTCGERSRTSRGAAANLQECMTFQRGCSCKTLQNGKRSGSIRAPPKGALLRFAHLYGRDSFHRVSDGASFPIRYDLRLNAFQIRHRG